MLEGWYCRTLAHQEATVKTEPEAQESDEEPRAAGSAPTASSSMANPAANPGAIDYKERYKNLKRKLKFIIYENEYFQDLMRTTERRLLKVSRDRTFLLDRLLLYEKPAKDSSDSDATDSSDDGEPSMSSAAAGAAPNTPLGTPKEAVRKRKGEGKQGAGAATGSIVSGATRGRKRKIQHTTLPTGQQLLVKKQAMMATVSPSPQQPQQPPQLAGKDVSLSTAEITRQLQERRPTPIEFMSPECTSATVPATMLSDESPSKCYPNESLQQLMEDDSHVAAEECVAMEYIN